MNNYHAFISYSHAADGKLAPALQSALEKFAKPWYKIRNLNIFRDEASLAANPHLWANIVKALDRSEYLIYLASPESANSVWVNDEIEYWLEHKSINNILIVLTEGKMEWDKQHNCFLNPNKNSLPPVLDDKFIYEPFYIDLRQSKAEEDLSLDNPIFKKEILKLAATLHGKTPNNLASEEVIEHRKMIRLRNASIGTLVILFVVAMFAGWFANEQRKTAVNESQKAQSLMHAAFSEQQINKNPTIAIRLAELAWKSSPSYPPPLPIQQTVYNSFYETLENNNLFYTNFLANESYDIVEFSPDGKRILTVLKNSITQVWDMLSETELYSLKMQGGNVNYAEFSPDGEKIVTASTSGEVKIWDAESGIELHTLSGHEKSVTSATFSPEGTKIVTASEDNTAKIWDVANGTEIHSLKHKEVFKAKFSPKGGKIITTGPKNRSVNAKIWDVKSGTELHLFEDYKDNFLLRSIFSTSFDNALFTPDEKIIVTSSFSDVLIWDAESGNGLNRIIGHSYSSPLITVDGSKLVTTSKNEINIWSIKSGKKLHTLKGIGGYIFNTRLSVDGKKLFACLENDTSLYVANMAKIWDIESGKEISTLMGHGSNYFRGVFSPDTNKLITISDSTSKMWNLHFNQDNFRLKGHKGIVSSFDISPNQKNILTTSQDSTAKMWDWKTKNVHQTFRGVEKLISIAEFSPDGKKVVTTSMDGSTMLWNAETGKKLLTLNYEEENYDEELNSYITYSSKFSPDGKKIITIFENQDVKIWDAESGEEILTLKTQEDVFFSGDGVWAEYFPKVYSAQFSSDGNKIATFSKYDDKVKVWDSKSGAEIKTVNDLEHNSWHHHPYYDGDKIIVIQNDTVKIWYEDLKKSHFINTEHKDEIITFNLSPDKKKIITASQEDSRFKIWDLESGEQLYSLTDHFAKNKSAEFSPNGKLIVTTSDDTKAKIWDSGTGKLLYIYEGDKLINGAKFFPDGKKILIISDKIAMTWLTPEGIMDWLSEQTNISKLSTTDLENLGIDFININE